MRIEAILFDLDDTLLGNDIESFIPPYFRLLTKYASKYIEPEQFQSALLAATKEMANNRGGALSNREVFWRQFSRQSGLDQAELESHFENFYSNEFDSLASTTEARTEAVDLLRSCFQLGLKVVIATNPMFPRTAIEKRLTWAGVPVSQFDYDLVTSYDNMHATKPSEAYYWEILHRLRCGPEASLMVGDSWTNDIVPASSIGMFTYWISNRNTAPPDSGLLSGHGSLEELSARISSGWLLTMRRPSAVSLS